MCLCEFEGKKNVVFNVCFFSPKKSISSVFEISQNVCNDYELGRYLLHIACVHVNTLIFLSMRLQNIVSFIGLFCKRDL